MIGEVGDIEMNDGRIFVLDEIQGQVLCFADDGTFLYEVGKRGQGPGEFTEPFTLSFENDTLAVFAQHGTVHFYRADGTYQNTVHLYDSRILPREGSFILSDRAYINSFPSEFRDVPWHLIVQLKPEPKVLWGFGRRPQYLYDHNGKRNRKLANESAKGFARVGETLWTSGMSTSFISVFDMEGRPLGSLAPGFDGLAEEDFRNVTTDEQKLEIAAKKRGTRQILPVLPYVIVLYANRTYGVDIFDVEGHLLLANSEMGSFPLANACATDHALIIPMFFNGFTEQGLLALFGDQMGVALEAGIDPQKEDTNPFLLVYKAIQP